MAGVAFGLEVVEDLLLVRARIDVDVQGQRFVRSACVSGCLFEDFAIAGWVVQFEFRIAPVLFEGGGELVEDGCVVDLR